MNEAMAELYQQMILEHNKKPRNFGPLTGATHSAEGFNPLCGDHYTVHLNIDSEGVVRASSFEGSGCAISKASASMMTMAIKDKSSDEVKAIFNEVHKLLTGKSENVENAGKLKIFAGIWKYPSRVKCASLAWHALSAAISGQRSVSTE
jgi:nitrogen fixation protein NifU and related proteins